jgi:hypothetical protein
MFKDKQTGFIINRNKKVNWSNIRTKIILLKYNKR